METPKTLGQWFVAAVLLVLACVGFSTAAMAASSITPGVFSKLTGTYIQPVSTSQSYATQIQTPALNVASLTTGGSLTKGPLDVSVVAFSVTGTSSPSTEIATTVPSTSSQLYLSWPQVPGATGYGIFIGTSTPGSEQSYFAATSTAGQVNNNYDLQSTSTPTYATLAGQGAGYYDSFNSASSSISTSGLISAVENATTSACAASLDGSMFDNNANAHLWLCTGAGPTWTLIK